MTIKFLDYEVFQWKVDREGLRAAREHLGILLPVRIDRVDMYKRYGGYYGIRKANVMALDLPDDNEYRFGYQHLIKVSKHLETERANLTVCHELVHAREQEQRQVHGIVDEERDQEELALIEQVEHEERLEGREKPKWKYDDYLSKPEEQVARAEQDELAAKFKVAVGL